MQLARKQADAFQVAKSYGETVMLVGIRAAKIRLDLARASLDDHAKLDSERLNISGSQAWLATVFMNPSLDSSVRISLAELLIAYVEVLAPYLHDRGADAQMVKWCAAALIACSYLGSKRGEILLIRGEAEYFLGLWEQALESIQGTLAESVPNTYARATLALGRFQLNRGEYSQALKTLEQAERLLRSQGDTKGVDTARAEKAAYYLNRRDLNAALELYLSLENLDRHKGATGALVTLSDHALLMVGIIYRKKGQYELSEKYFRHLILRGETAGDKGSVAAASHHIAWLYLEKGNLTLAKRFCGRAGLHYRQIEDLRGRSDAYEQLGLIALADGNRDLAGTYLRRSLAMRLQLGNKQGAASSLRRLTSVYLAQGQVLPACRSLCRSLAIYQRIGVLTVAQLINIAAELWHWLIVGYRMKRP